MSDQRGNDAIITPKIEDFGDDVLDFAWRIAADLCLGNEPRTRNELDTTAFEKIWSHPAAERVNVTFRRNGIIRGSMAAPGANLGEQLKGAVARSLDDRRFSSPLTCAELPSSTLEVWIQIGSEPIPVDLRESADPLVLGVHGVEFELNGLRAYFKPSVASTSRHSTAQRLFRALVKKAGAAPDSWKSPVAHLKRTTWIGLLRDPENGNLTLDGVHKSSNLRSEEPSTETMWTWIEQCVEYFAANQLASGEIVYDYDPFKNLVDKDRSNRVRSAGCLYALSTATDVAVTRINASAAATACKLARWLISHSVAYGEDGLVVSERRQDALPKLGATALVAAALSRPRMRSLFPDGHRRFINAVRSAALPNGGFTTHFGSSTEDPIAVNFFPGQALVALQLNLDDPAYQRICQLAFLHYRDHFRSSPSRAFVGWHIEAWAKLARSCENSQWADFVFEQADWLSEQQLTNASNANWNGGFAVPGKAPAFSSIVYTEAMIHALGAAALVGNRARAERYSTVARNGLIFCGQLRLDRIPQSFFPDPDRARGGIALDLVDKSVRCDVVQHFLTMCLESINQKDELF